MVSVPVLSLHSTSTPASSSIADRRETIAFCLDRARAPRAMVTDITAGIATGTEAISSTRTNWAIAPTVDPAPDVGHHDVAIDLKADQQQRQRAGEQDQEVADLQHRLLGVRFRPCPGHQLGGAAEEGLVAGGGNHRGHRALLGDAARIGAVADALGDRQGFAGECGLVDAEIVAGDQEHVGRHDLAGGDGDHVAGHQVGGIDRQPLVAAQRARLQRQALLERGQRVGGLVVLPEADRGVVEQEAGHHGEIRPVPAQERNQRRRLDHPGDRPPEIARELAPTASLVRLNGVGAILLQPALGLVDRQALGRGAELAQPGCDGRRTQRRCGGS